jgi:hypothetical protein
MTQPILRLDDGQGMCLLESLHHHATIEVKGLQGTRPPIASIFHSSSLEMLVLHTSDVYL